jgi:hypothetical protein
MHGSERSDGSLELAERLLYSSMHPAESVHLIHDGRLPVVPSPIIDCSETGSHMRRSEPRRSVGALIFNIGSGSHG